MAKSEIIKELANSTIDTATALKRAKVLLSELEVPEISKWIDFEITGYPDNESLPSYRIAKGNLIGSYYKGSLASHMTWNNVSIPLGDMPDDIKDSLLQVSFRQGADALKQLAKDCSLKEGHIGKSIPADIFPTIAMYNNDLYMMITSAKVVVGEQIINDIFSTVESRLLDILIALEKEFGNLDELDIDVSSKTSEDLKAITDRIILIMYQDQRVTIGDNNKIKDSTIATSVNS